MIATESITMEQVSADSIQMRTLGQKDIVPASTDVDEIGSMRGATAEMDDYPTGLKFWLIFITLGALLILGGLDTNIVATAVPRLACGQQKAVEKGTNCW